MNSQNPFLQDAIALPFKDKNWGTKFLIGAALIFANGIIPIIPFLFFSGYLYRIQHRVTTEKSGPVLPEWDDWGGLLKDGLKYMGALFVYFLPVVVLVGGGYILLFGSSMLMPLFIEANQDASPILFLFTMVGIFGGGIVMMLGMLLSLFIGLLSPAALVHMSAQDDFRAAFRVNEWWKIVRANLSGYVLALLVTIGLTMVASVVFQVLYFFMIITIILCFLYPFALGAMYYYIGVVSANIAADAYNNGQTKIDLPAIPVEI